MPKFVIDNSEIEIGGTNDFLRVDGLSLFIAYSITECKEFGNGLYCTPRAKIFFVTWQTNCAPREAGRAQLVCQGVGGV